MVEAVLLAIGDGAFLPERGEAGTDAVENGLDAADVEIGVVLAGKRRRREVFKGGRGAHRKGGRSRELGQLQANGLIHRIGQRQRFELPAQIGGFLAQSNRIIDVESIDALQQRAGMADKFAVGGRGNDETGRYREILLGEQREIGALAAG